MADQPHFLARTAVGKKLADSAPGAAGTDLLDYLTARGVSDEVAEARGYGLTDGRTDLPDTALPGGARTWFDAGMAHALTIPLINPEGDVATVQMRFQGAGLPRPDGVGHAKFATPPGVPRRNRRAGIPADIHPLARPLLDDRTVPVLITEGVVKADAVLSAARAEETAIATMAITGVTMLADSARNGGRTVLHPESWGELASTFKDRVVILAWDADARSKKPVAQALQTAAHGLVDAGADVRVWIAPVEVGAKAGIDDWLVGERKRGARKPIEKGLIGKARPWAKVEAELAKAKLIWVARTPRPANTLDLAAFLSAGQWPALMEDVGLVAHRSLALRDDGLAWSGDVEPRMLEGWTVTEIDDVEEATPIDVVVAIDERGGQALLARTEAGRLALGGARSWTVIDALANIGFEGDLRRAEAIAGRMERDGAVSAENLQAGIDAAGDAAQTVEEALVALRAGRDNELPFESQDGSQFVARFSTDPRVHGWWEIVQRSSLFGGAMTEERRCTAWLAGVAESTSTRTVAVDGSTRLADVDKHVVRIILPGGTTVSTGQMEPRSASNPMDIVNAVMSTAAIEGPASPSESTPMRKMLALFGRTERQSRVVVSRCGWVRLDGRWAYVTPTGALRESGWDEMVTAAPVADPSALAGMSPFIQHFGFSGVEGQGNAADLAEWAADFMTLIPGRPMVGRILLAAFFGAFLPSSVRPAISISGKEGSGKTAIYRALAATLLPPSFADGREPLAAVKIDADSEAASIIAAAFLGQAPLFSDDMRRDQHAPERTRAMAKLVDLLISATADQAGGARFDGAGRARRADVLGNLFLSGEVLELNRSRADRTIALRLAPGDLDQKALDAYRAKWLSTGRARAAIYGWLRRAVISRNAPTLNFVQEISKRVTTMLEDESDQSRATQTSAFGVLQGLHALRFLGSADWDSHGMSWLPALAKVRRVADDPTASALVAEIRELAGLAKSTSDPGRDVIDEIRDGLAAGRYYLRAANGADITDFIATECGWRWTGAKTRSNEDGTGGEPIASFYTMPAAVEIGRLSDQAADGSRRVFIQAGALPAIKRAAGIELRKGAETDDALTPYLAAGTRPGNVGWLQTAGGAKTTGYGYQVDAALLSIGLGEPAWAPAPQQF